MKKRLISTLLMGALVVASTSVFVSCKDYDDDIKDLQTQINSLNGLVNTKETTIKESISNLQTTLDGLSTLEASLKKAIADGDAATLSELKAALASGDAETLAAAKALLEAADADVLAKALAAISEGDLATLAAAQQAVKDAKEALEKTLNEQYNSLLEKNADQDAKILAAQAAADQALTQMGAIESKLQAGIDAVKTAAETAQKAADDAAAAAEAAKQAADQGLENAAAAQEAADQAKATAEAAAAAAAIAQESISTLQNSLETVNGKLITINNDLTDLKNNFVTLDNKVATAITDLSELKTAVNGQKKALEDEIARLEEKIAAGDNAAEVAELKAKLDEAQTTITTLNNKIAEIEGKLQTAISVDVKNVTETIDQLNSRIEATNDAVTALQEAMANAAQKNDVSTISSNVSALSNSIDLLSNELAENYSEVNTLINVLAKALRSLVYQPYLYVDGIESIHYPWLHYTELLKENLAAQTRQRTGTPNHSGGKNFDDEREKTVQGLNDYVYSWMNDSYSYGPVWPVQYHLNPTSANVTFDDVKGWNVRQAEEITRSWAAGGITVEELYSDGETKAFSVKNGTLTVGLKVASPADLADHTSPLEENGRPGYHTDDTYWTYSLQYDDIIALQVNSTENGETKTITSDYAQIFPEEIQIEGIVWNKHLNKIGFTAVNYDETGACSVKSHVWDTPQEALGITDASVYPDIELLYNDANGIDLAELLGIHLYRTDGSFMGIFGSKAKYYQYAFGSDMFKKLGLKAEFELIDYTIDGNLTHDSKYAKLDGSTIIAQNVTEEGVTYEDQSATSVDREPLVRVLLKDANNHVIKDGYILVHITRTIPGVTAEKLVIDEYDQLNTAASFDLCNDKTIMSTTWAQFSKWVLTDELENMTKDDFDAQYGVNDPGVPDVVDASAATVLSDGSKRYDDVIIYKNTNGAVATASDFPGTVHYFHNTNGTTNHRFEWEMTAEELEHYTHDLATSPKEVTMYFRYTRNLASAKYEYIYVKMTVKLSRNTIWQTGIQTKNSDYWYAYTGDNDGFDAVVWNPWYPQDGGDTKTFRQYLKSTFQNNNQVRFTNTSTTGGKFFFVPVETTITSMKGVTYTITPRSSATDEKWNAFVCLYDLHPAKYTTHKWGTAEENKEIHEKCAIDYNDGVYTNKTLYAVTGTTYTPIATLTENGQMDLIWRTPDDDVTKEVLNAIGYYDNVHSNILDELHTTVGYIGKNGCDVAVNIIEKVDGQNNKNAATFYVSWQRPINVINDGGELVDAKNNGDYIYTVDFLKLYDWRGPVEGYMWGDNQWLWAYYNVKSIKIDTRPSQMWTDMGRTDGKFVKMNTISSQVNIGVLKKDGSVELRQQTTIELDLTAYNAAAQNDALRTYMGIAPADATKKANFAGGIFYSNNGDNVQPFTIRVPVTITYDWGEFTTNVDILIKPTKGNQGA